MNDPWVLFVLCAVLVYIIVEIQDIKKKLNQKP
jgi:hypothetical protein